MEQEDLVDLDESNDSSSEYSDDDYGFEALLKRQKQGASPFVVVSSPDDSKPIRYLKLFTNLIGIPFCQGVFYGFGEVVARYLFKLYWPVRKSIDHAVTAARCGFYINQPKIESSQDGEPAKKHKDTR